jgi:hypothetical protein
MRASPAVAVSVAAPDPASSSSAPRRRPASRRLVDRNANAPRVKALEATSTADSLDHALAATATGTAAGDRSTGDGAVSADADAGPSNVEEMVARERARQEAKQQRAERKRRDAEIKKRQIAQLELKQTMKHRHWARLEDQIVHPPPPPAKERKEAVPEPGEFEVDSEFIHPATVSYHTMRRLRTDITKVHPMFLGYPVDLPSARTVLVPDWKRALERKRPLPMHPALRHPGMIGYTMHAKRAFDPVSQ